MAQDGGVVIRKVSATDADFKAALQSSPAPVAATTVAGAPLDAIGLNSKSKAAAVGSVMPAPVTTTDICSYTVRSGDTLSKIAARELGSASRWTELPPLNAGVNKNNLRIGAQLQLPCGVGGVGQGVAGSPPAATPALQTPAPLPVWTAKSGEYFSDALTRWGKQAGYKVVIDTREDWQFSVAVSEQGTFQDVLQRVVRGLAAQGTAPAVQVYANNVITVGG